MPAEHKIAWSRLKGLIEGFFGNRRDPNYRVIVEELLDSFKKIEVNMSVKVHMLHAHLDEFPDNCGAFSDEQGERFHQEIAVIEKRFKGKKKHVNMLAFYCDSLVRKSNIDYKRKGPASRLYFGEPI